MRKETDNTRLELRCDQDKMNERELTRQTSLLHYSYTGLGFFGMGSGGGAGVLLSVSSFTVASSVATRAFMRSRSKRISIFSFIATPYLRWGI